MGQRKVRRGIVFVAVLEVAILCLVVSGIGLWPEREEHADAAGDCADADECLELLGETGKRRIPEPYARDLGDHPGLYWGQFESTKRSYEPPRTCVFEATVESVDEADPGVAHVLIHEPDGRRTKALVYSDRRTWRGVPTPAGETVTYFCAGKSEKNEALPQYEDCVRSSDPLDIGACVEPTGCIPSLDGSTAPFRKVLAVGSSTASESKDGCVHAADPSEGCIGTCFNAFVKSVDEEDWRNASVAIIEADGTRTPAFVRRVRVRVKSRQPARDGMPVRFACFDGGKDGDGVGRFDGCVQMPVPPRDDDAAHTAYTSDIYDDPLGDFPFGL